MNKFLKEISEQPLALRNTLSHYTSGEGYEALEKVSSLWKTGDFDNILFTGMGSSFFAPNTASCLLSSYGINSVNINAGELLHYHLSALRSERSLLTCVSQSGESYEIVKVIEKLLPEKTWVGITNEDSSTLALRSSVALLSKAGKEEMTSTKTYISTLLVLHFYASALAERWQKSSADEIYELIDKTEKLITDNQQWLPEIMDFIGQPEFIQLIGRGPSYSTVLQGALMVMEASRRPASGMLGGEFRHGPLEMSKKGFRAVVLAPEGPTWEQGVKLANDITRFGGRVLFVTNKSVDFHNDDILPFIAGCKNEYLFPITSVIPLQFIVNSLAEKDGHEPGNFIMGAKVTITE
jgi:glutamine---fructose-6-phosphate transaminase (isomerizing)